MHIFQLHRHQVLILLTWIIYLNSNKVVENSGYTNVWTTVNIGIFFFATLICLLSKGILKTTIFKMNYQTSSKVLVCHIFLGSANPLQSVALWIHFCRFCLSTYSKLKKLNISFFPVYWICATDNWKLKLHKSSVHEKMKSLIFLEFRNSSAYKVTFSKGRLP